MTKHILASLAYIVQTFPLGYLWHLKFFQAHYKSLGGVSRGHDFPTRVPVHGQL